MKTDINVKLISSTSNPESLVTAAANICYEKREDFENIDVLSNPKLIKNVIKMGHLSILEHVSFTFLITGMSRACSHQLVRHRLASFSQRSQRYIDEADFDYVVPDSIKRNKAVSADFTKLMQRISAFYKTLLSLKTPKEDARYILPNAAATSLIVTMNARELTHFITLRTCLRAQWEIRKIADKMLALASEKAGVIFENAGPACVRGECTEGKLTCGKIEQVRERYRKKY